MRRLAAIIVALVLPGLALAQNLYPTPADWRAWDRDYASPGGSTEVMRLPFDAPGCYASGTVVGTRGEALTFIRATTATVADCSGVVQTCASGQFRVGCAGLLVERSADNRMSRTRDLTNVGSWANTGSPTITSDQGPANFTDLDKVQSSAATDVRYQTTTVPSSTGPWSLSATIAADSGSKVESLMFGINGGQTLTGCSCYRESKASCTFATTTANQGYAYGTFTTTPDRMTIVCSATVAQTTIYPGAHDGQYNSTGNVGGLFGRYQLEVGATATSEIPCTTAPCSRNADIGTVTLPATLLAAPSKWCVSATATAYAGAWPSSGRKNICSMGTRAGANSWSVYVNNGWFAPHVYGASGNFYAYTATIGASPTSLKAWANGGTVGGSANSTALGLGAGTAMTAQPVTLFLGADSSYSATEYADAYIRDLRIYRSPACR